MAAISKIIRGAISRASAPETSDIAIASNALNISAAGVRAIAQGGKQTAKNMQGVMQFARSGRITQAESATTAQKLGDVAKTAAHLKRLKPVALQAFKDWEQAEKDRADIVTAGVKAAANVAEINAKTQRTVYNLHADGQFNTQYHQSAYGGGNFSV